MWTSAFGTQGICRELVALLLTHPERGGLKLLTCEQVSVETLRALRLKFRVTEEGLTVASAVLAGVESVGGIACPSMPVNFPDPDDWPILCWAVEARTDCFVTGDKALLDLGQIEGMPIISPRAAYQRLRGLA